VANLDGFSRVHAPGPQRVFVSDEHGDVDAVIDTKTNSLVATMRGACFVSEAAFEGRAACSPIAKIKNANVKTVLLWTARVRI
jgi:hypothetical protein